MTNYHHFRYHTPGVRNYILHFFLLALRLGLPAKKRQRINEEGDVSSHVRAKIAVRVINHKRLKIQGKCTRATCYLQQMRLLRQFVSLCENRGKGARCETGASDR